MNRGRQWMFVGAIAAVLCLLALYLIVVVPKLTQPQAEARPTTVPGTAIPVMAAVQLGKENRRASAPHYPVTPEPIPTEQQSFVVEQATEYARAAEACVVETEFVDSVGTVPIYIDQPTQWGTIWQRTTIPIGTTIVLYQGELLVYRAGCNPQSTPKAPSVEQLVQNGDIGIISRPSPTVAP